MNYKIIDDYIFVYCHGCNQIIERGDLNFYCENIYCILCGAHLGYRKDLPNES